MKTNYVLIDYENVRVSSLDLLHEDHFRIWVFLGPGNTRLEVPLVLAIQRLGERAAYITMTTRGANALDFHIAYYLGALSAADPNGFFHIISKDTGFDPLIQHLKTKEILSARSDSIETMPCFEQKTEPTDPEHKVIDEEMVNAVIADLIKRKAAKPSTPATLLSTIRKRCGNNVPGEKAEEVYKALVDRQYVTIEGKKVAYHLPAPS